MTRVHVHDLLCDCDHRLILLHLELADAEVSEAGEFQIVKLVHALLELLTLLILSQEVIGDITKVKVAIDLLVDFRGLDLVSTLEEFACRAFKLQ